MQTKLARNVFSAPWEFPWSVCKKRLWVELGIFLGDFNFDVLLTVPDELGELFQARWTQTKLPRIFFNALWEFLSKFGQKAFMSRILHFILVISTLIFCPLCLMLSSFCVAFFVGGLPHKKGVCIRSLVFNCFNHFDSKWRVKYAALFVVGALSHAIWMQRKLSRNFLQRFVGVSSNILQKTFMNRILHFFWWFQLWYFAHCAWCFPCFLFYFLLGGYLIKRVFVYEV